MILPGVNIISRHNEQALHSGIDSYKCCNDKNHYRVYLYDVSYNYNSRGFRDHEWPGSLTDFKKTIWCVGDSFTSGIGSPFEHTWPQVLSKRLGQRTINVSLDGASNNWIARQAKMRLTEIAPDIIIVHWSFSHRREKDINEVLDPIWQNYYDAIKDPLWPDCKSYMYVNRLPDYVQKSLFQDPKSASWFNEFDVDSDRRLAFVDSTADEDFTNTQDCINQLGCDAGTKIIHSFIPNWHVTNCSDKLNFNNQPVIPEFSHLDYARDGFHYDIKTSEYFVDQLVSLI